MDSVNLENGRISVDSVRKSKLQRFTQMIIPSSILSNGQPRMAHLETLEAKMASIEVSLSSSTPRRRKGTSLGGSISARASPRPSEITPTKEYRSALQDREAVIQNLRVQLGLGKLPRTIGTPLEESERPAAEQKLQRLRIDADNKRIAIRNLKVALDKLDITDNIDVRIRQAELEYALGREELQLLSLVEEARALQLRLDKSKPEANTLYSMIKSGINLSIQAVQATVGRWAACTKPCNPGLWVEWVLDGEGLCRGDRIIEVNGNIVACKTKEELQKLIGCSGGKCQLVVIRKRSASIQQHQLIQTQEDNQRLQHRISYLEDQVKELQMTRDDQFTTNSNGKTSHVTSINISSPPTTPPDKPQIFQRGNFVTTIVGGKPVENPPTIVNNVTKTTIKEHNGCRSDSEGNFFSQNKGISGSKVSLNSDITYIKRERERQREKELKREEKERQRAVERMNKKTNWYMDGSNYQSNGHLSSRSVEHLSYGYRSADSRLNKSQAPNRNQRLSTTATDMRSVKSLDFESDNGECKRDVDYTSEPVAPKIRPTPPKKPLRLSLQRAQSLQTVEATVLENEKKRAAKRTYKGKISDLNYNENIIMLQTASLGRNHV